MSPSGSPGPSRCWLTRRARSGPAISISASSPRALTEAFKNRASELATSRLKVEQTTLALEQRRRYVETILERITTGVISINSSGIVTTINSAAARLLGVPRTVVGQPAVLVFNRPDLEALAPLLSRNSKQKGDAMEREVTIAREGHESHLTVAATPIGDGSAGVLALWLLLGGLAVSAVALLF